MNIKVDKAISGGIYLDKQTNTFVDNKESVNLVIHDDTKSGIHKIVEVISNVTGLNDTEKEIYYYLIEEQLKGIMTVNIADNVPKMVKSSNKSERSIYKAIKSLVDKRIITYRGVNAIQINIGYNFAKPHMNDQKFLIIRLTD